jgi:phosphatidylserine decarboxylase
MDPFVVASLGKKTYRTHVIRHNLNPSWDEKMVFQVQRQESNYSFYFSVVDRDKLSGNDFVADCSFPLQDIINLAPDANPETGLYSLPEPAETLSPTQSKGSRFRLPLSRNSSAQSLSKLVRPSNSRKTSSSNIGATSPGTGPPGENTLAVPQTTSPVTTIPEDSSIATPEMEEDLKAFTLTLNMRNKDRWEDKHNPELNIKAKYVPYPALRQQFWRVLLKQYDADDSGLISKVELSTMLDTLGSTLKEETINDFFKRFATSDGEDINNIELTMDQAVICLEDQLDQSHVKKKPQTLGESIKSKLPDLSSLSLKKDDGKDDNQSSEGAPLSKQSTQGGDGGPLSITTTDSSNISGISTLQQDQLGTPGEEGDFLDKDDLNDTGEERVIQITECPLCHQPRLNKRSETDIVTHIATCASQDWRKVNTIVMGGFVTSSQAQRKWYSKIITKIGYGGYKLGANSANILVQDRITGQINEEKMSVYVRLGIRLLYKGLKSREMETKRSEFDP